MVAQNNALVVALTASATINPLDNTVLEIAKRIFEAQTHGLVDADLLRGVAGQLLSAVTSGYGKSIADLQWNTPDFQMLDHLTTNVYHFSAAKNYHELRDITLALRDGDRLREWPEFREAASQINQKYNATWLQTEYESAVAGGQMASRWTDFEANKKRQPFLRYQTVGDSNVRDAHRMLDGITKNMDDSFWDTHYPPNGWRCRCDVIQLPSARFKETPADKTPGMDGIPPMFQTNLAKSKLVFPASHPYYFGIPENLIEQHMKHGVRQYYDGLVKKWAENNIQEGGVIHKLKNFESGELHVTRKSIKRVAGHLVGSNKLIVSHLEDMLPKFKFAGKEEVKEKQNADTKRNRGVTHFNYYDRDMGDKTVRIHAEVIENKLEKLYSISIKAKDQKQ